jgi:hypothetical protein
MHAGIGATGANHRDRLNGDTAKRSLEGFLHGWQPRLTLCLPTEKMTTLVLHRQCNTIASGKIRRERPRHD